jgi:hypothetical protein
MAVAVFLDIGGQRGAVIRPQFTYAAVAGAIVAVVTSLVVPTYLADALRRSPAPSDVSDARRYAQMYQTLLIIRCAILEGAAFFCLVSYILEHHVAALAAALVLLTIILMQFPTSSRLEAWIENELAVAEQMKQLR